MVSHSNHPISNGILNHIKQICSSLRILFSSQSTSYCIWFDSDQSEQNEMNPIIFCFHIVVRFDFDWNSPEIPSATDEIIFYRNLSINYNFSNIIWMWFAYYISTVTFVLAFERRSKLFLALPISFAIYCMHRQSQDRWLKALYRTTLLPDTHPSDTHTKSLLSAILMIKVE